MLQESCKKCCNRCCTKWCKGCCKTGKITNFDDKLALGLAALIFSVGLFYLSSDKFNPTNFCVMNGIDPFCKNRNHTSCFNKEDNSVFADNFGFGGFIEINSGFGFLFTLIH